MEPRTSNFAPPSLHSLVRLIVAVASFALAACTARDTSPASTPPAQAFWEQLATLCGNAYEGRVEESLPPDTVMSSARLVMHVRSCSPDSIRIPFHIGENRSRTWVLTRTDSGLRLKHDHRHEDGVADSVTQYGGDTRDAGTAQQQAFAADAFTAQLIPAAATNVWTIELVPGERFSYALRREGTDRRFRAVFDLSRAVTAPPPPWGAEP